MTMKAVDEGSRSFAPAVSSLIEGTVALMRGYEIGYPTLDRLTGDVDGFADLLSPAFRDVVRLGADRDADEPDAYLDELTEPAAFAGEARGDGHARGLNFWAFVRAIQDLSITSGQYGLNEVARNTGFFGHLASTLRTFRNLEGVDGSEAETCPIYWADLASERLESTLGADFALVFALGEDRYKVAFLQAKRVKEWPFADVSHKVGDERQVDLLVRHERLHTFVGATTDGVPEPGVHGVAGHWCFYLFWHEVTAEGHVLLPTVRSAVAVKETTKGGRTGSLDHGVEFAAFAALLLADADSNVGYPSDAGRLPDLFKGHRPHALIFIDPPSNGPTPEDKASLLRAMGYRSSPHRPGLVAARMADDNAYTPKLG